MDRVTAEVARRADDPVLWTKTVGTVTEVRFGSGRSLFLSETRLTMFSPLSG